MDLIFQTVLVVLSVAAISFANHLKDKESGNSNGKK